MDSKTGAFVTKRGSIGTAAYGKMIPCNQHCGNWYHSGKHCANIYGKKIRARNFQGPCCTECGARDENLRNVGQWQTKETDGENDDEDELNEENRKYYEPPDADENSGIIYSDDDGDDDHDDDEETTEESEAE
jgi:hypothetical protein